MILDWVMRRLGFRCWEDDARVNIKVPGWYLRLDPGARRLAQFLKDNPEKWQTPKDQ